MVELLEAMERFLSGRHAGDPTARKAAPAVAVAYLTSVLQPSTPNMSLRNSRELRPATEQPPPGHCCWLDRRAQSSFGSKSFMGVR